MDSRAAIGLAILSGQNIVEGYLGDLTDADILVRPVPGTNHIAWQLGHLIAAEHGMVNAVAPGTMPPLPEGFAAQHANNTAGSDDPAAFLKKDDYLRIFREQRAGTMAALAKQSDADLDAPSPEKFRHFLPSVGALFSMQGTHWMMHAGQWAVIRRKLGRKPLF